MVRRSAVTPAIGAVRRREAVRLVTTLVVLVALTAFGAPAGAGAAAPTRSSWPHDLAAVGERLFFTADDGTHGSELWTSDGTRAGTRMVRDINRLAP